MTRTITAIALTLALTACDGSIGVSTPDQCLRNAGGMPAIGTYDGRNPQWTGWVPLPVVPAWMRDDPHA